MMEDPAEPSPLRGSPLRVESSIPRVPGTRGVSPSRPAMDRGRFRRRRVAVPGLLVIFLFLTAGCGGGGSGGTSGAGNAEGSADLGEPSEPPPPPSTGAPELLDQLEERLLRESGVRIPFHIVAEGALAVDLQGTLVLADGNRLRLECQGTFGPDRVEALLLSDGSRMVRTVNGGSEEGMVPSHLRNGVVLGLTRMGLLHNLARLVAGAFPDATDGSADAWVQAMDPAHGGADPAVPTAVAVGFGVRVAGEPAGEAILWLDPVSDVPLLRRQVVRFPGGEMRVTERYLEPVADLEIADSLFVHPAPGIP
jgi:hypothetical protein